MKKYSTFVLIVLTLAGLVIVWLGYTRHQDFVHYHQTIADDAVTGLSHQVSRFVKERNRLVRVFSEDNAETIRKILQATTEEKDALIDKLQKEISRYFPQHFAFTVTDENGRPAFEDFDGLVGELCEQDIQYFSSQHNYQPRIHPHSEVYHFDVMAHLKQAILFISFDANMLTSMIANAQVPGHQLMLVYPEGDNLIEVTASGPRINLDRLDYRLNEDEKRRILSTEDVAGTSWQAMDVSIENLFINNQRNLVKQSLLIYLMFAIICSIMLIYLRREERRRAIAEGHKDEFLSVVSHELRTPLTSIRGSLGLILGGVTGDISDKTREIAGIAMQNCERLSTLVNDILDLQKIEAGKLQYQMINTELDALVERAVACNRDYGNQLGTVFEIHNQAPGALIHADENRLIQVLTNLLSNAAKYGADEDTVEIQITRRANHVRVSITDHGDGIPGNLKERIFDSFTQADNSSSRKIAGTGLGLNIAKHIIEEHHGTLDFESLDNGTCFYFELAVID
ncbi:sensor histidine kinase [Sulfuriflexus mobilis]|uniref:sensor histidine kinase n=1 Tax=Sulfuriflexus mobilis TaxID=1811807 RepID=UPI000F847340|nr:HAMP domain-containing sensor histidine kinase [Sulfuriflexus mobilis]